MSDFPQGPGWWQATDGKWYPPEPPPPPSGVGSSQGPGQGGAPIDTKGFVKSLYDFKLDSYVTPRVLRFLYAVVVLLLTLGAVLFLLASLASGDSSAATAAVIVIPIGYFLYLVFTRIYFELIAAFFRMADDVRAIRRSSER